LRLTAFAWLSYVVSAELLSQGIFL
jgi:hypothetical protein